MRCRSLCCTTDSMGDTMIITECPLSINLACAVSFDKHWETKKRKLFLTSVGHPKIECKRQDMAEIFKIVVVTMMLQNGWLQYRFCCMISLVLQLNQLTTSAPSSAQTRQESSYVPIASTNPAVSASTTRSTVNGWVHQPTKTFRSYL